MRNEKIGEFHFFLKIFQKVEYLALNGNIKSRNRFVANNELWFHSKGSGNTNTLALASGELVRIAKTVFRPKAALLQNGHYIIIKLGILTQSVIPDSLSDDIPDIHSRVEASVGVLENNLHVLTYFPGIFRKGFRHILTLKMDAASGGLKEVKQTAAGSTFPAPGFTYESQSFLLLYKKGDVIHRSNMSYGSTKNASLDGKVLFEIANRKIFASWLNQEFHLLSRDRFRKASTDIFCRFSEYKGEALPSCIFRSILGIGYGNGIPSGNPVGLEQLQG